MHYNRDVTITVRFFAILRERSGLSEVELTIPAGSSAAATRAALAEMFPAIADFLPKVAVAVNREYVTPDFLLSDGDELALIPAVSGG